MTLTSKMHFVKFHLQVASCLPSRGQRKYAPLGMRLLWKYIRNHFLVYHLILHFVFISKTTKDLRLKFWIYNKKNMGFHLTSKNPLLPVEAWGMRMWSAYTPLISLWNLESGKPKNFKGHLGPGINNNLRALIFFLFFFFQCQIWFSNIFKTSGIVMIQHFLNILLALTKFWVHLAWWFIYFDALAYCREISKLNSFQQSWFLTARRSFSSLLMK